MRLVAAIGDSPWGPFRIAGHDRAIVAVELLATEEGFVTWLARRGLPAPVPVEAEPGRPAAILVRETCSLIEAFLRGDAVDLAQVAVDLSDRPEWDRLVLDAVRAVPRGSTVSYGEVARRIGRPGAARAVGGAVGRNPVGIIVPCHRVIAGNGSIGGYGAAAWGGREAATALKRDLLALEGVFPADRVSPR